MTQTLPNTDPTTHAPALAAPHPLAGHFRHPLVALGQTDDAALAGVLTPEPEAGAARVGVDRVFLEDAENYYARYQGFGYWKMLIERAVAELGLSAPELIVEFGCGFGNATLPALELFPEARVIATDISPNLLAILNRLLAPRGLSERCLAATMDAQKPYIRDSQADLVLGAAILHHLVDPGVFVRRAMDVLKPGRAAVFFEPMEGGNAVLRLMCQEIAAEGARRRDRSRAVAWVAAMPAQLAPQILRGRQAGWTDLNDKWAFPRSLLSRIAAENGARLEIFPLHDNKGQFRRQLAYMLTVYGEIPETALPGWAWEIVRRFDEDVFSPEMLTDLPLEACIAFVKPDR